MRPSSESVCGSKLRSTLAKPINKVIFTNIPVGQYAIRFFQDENNNGTLDTNLFGMPSEGYGFSNNAKPNYGPVGYQDAAFTVTEQQDPVINQTHIIY
ncbi:DUF2141 domain-containing protein [Shewanella sp. SG44-6]|nr:DUF2141 domain-containing protein [Shewanella sp. SG44-6]